MKIHAWLAGLLALVSLSLHADVLTPEQALDRAKNSTASGSTVMRKLADSAVSPRLVYTVSTDGTPGCYIFDIDGTGLVVAADDIARPVLGRLDNSASLGEGEQAPAMIYWLETLSAEIDYARKNKSTSIMRTLSDINPEPRPAIEPMCATRWNQNSPYNLLCPEIDGGISVTGCSATAMAQVMKYHNYPQKGVGFHSYNLRGQNISFDYENTEFDWENMLDTYTGQTTKDQKRAVATLMVAAGVSVDMSYSPNSSGAMSTSIPPALIKYFNYDKAVHIELRGFYTDSQWEDLVYSQLALGPVIYDGQSNSGGHSFVCDGYDGEGYFHFNWGWGGLSDGYFLLSALDPESQGIGGSTSGFDFMQDIIAGIQPPVEGSEYVEQLLCGEGVYSNQDMTSLGGRLSIYGNFYNYSAITLEGATLAAHIVSPDGYDEYIEANKGDLKPLFGTSEFTIVVPTDLAEGTYYITPAYKTANSDGWRAVRTPPIGPQAIKMVVEGTLCFLSSIDGAEVVVSDFVELSPIHAYSAFKSAITLENTSDIDFFGTLALYFYNEDLNSSSMTSYFNVEVPAGETVTTEQILSMRNYYILPGNYEVIVLRISNDYNTAIFVENKDDQAFFADVEEGRVVTELEVTDLTTPDGVLEDLDPDNLNFMAFANCISGLYSSGFTLYIFLESDLSNPVGALYSDPITLSTGESAELNFSGKLENAIPGETYRAAVFAGRTQVSSSILFTVREGSGICGITDDSRSRRLVTPSGLSVYAEKAIPGRIYISPEGKFILR